MPSIVSHSVLTGMFESTAGNLGTHPKTNRKGTSPFDPRCRCSLVHLISVENLASFVDDLLGHC